MGATDCDRVDLDDECWIDLHRGWATGDGALFEELETLLPWQQEPIVLFGREVLQPRLTAWLGLGMESTTRYRTTKPATEWPPSLLSMRVALTGHTGVEFNSALANLYRDGADSVAWHADDEPTLGRDPVIASLSLGAPRRFRLRRRDRSADRDITLGEGDLLIMGGATQRLWLHCVPKTAHAVGQRMNLTFRRYQVETA